MTEPPLTVPAPGGRDLPARPAPAADLPGLEGTRGAAAADVGGLRVVSVPGGGPRARLRGAGRSRAPPCGSTPSRWTARRPGWWRSRRSTFFGAEDRWALRVIDGHVVLVRGRGDAPERYAASL